MVVVLSMVELSALFSEDVGDITNPFTNVFNYDYVSDFDYDFVYTKQKYENLHNGLYIPLYNALF